MTAKQSLAPPFNKPWRGLLRGRAGQIGREREKGSKKKTPKTPETRNGNGRRKKGKGKTGKPKGRINPRKASRQGKCRTRK